MALLNRTVLRGFISPKGPPIPNSHLGVTDGAMEAVSVQSGLTVFFFEFCVLRRALAAVESWLYSVFRVSGLF